MQDNHPGRVEDYTTANLVLIFVNMLWIFVWIWSAWGLGPVLILGALLNSLVSRLQAARNRRERRFAKARARRFTEP